MKKIIMMLFAVLLVLTSCAGAGGGSDDLGDRSTNKVPVIAGQLPALNARSARAINVDYTNENRATITMEMISQTAAPILTNWATSEEVIESGDTLTYYLYDATLTVTVTVAEDLSVNYSGVFSDGESTFNATLTDNEFTYSQDIVLYCKDTINYGDEVIQSFFSGARLTGTLITNGYNANGLVYRVQAQMPEAADGWYRYQYNYTSVKARDTALYLLNEVHNSSSITSRSTLVITPESLANYEAGCEAVKNNASDGTYTIIHAADDTWVENWNPGAADAFNLVP